MRRSVVHLTAVHRAFDPRIFYKECRTLARAGYDVTLVAPAEYRNMTRDQVRVIGVAPARSRWQRPRVWWFLLRQAVRQRPTVVHLHDPELLLMAPCLRGILGSSVSIVYDVHEYVVDSVAQKTWIPDRWRGIVARLVQITERALGHFVDGLVFAVEEQAPLYAGWRAAGTVIHNYPELSAFADARPVPELPPDRFRLIYIGSLYARRGIMTMLEALSLLKERVPEVLLVLGGAFDSQDFRRECEAFVSAHGLNDHLLLLGWIDHTKVKDYLASADVAWLPALLGPQYQRRSISTKQLECMVAGLPIVAGDHPHLRSFIEEAECGLLVDASDPAAHAEAILWLYQHPTERREMGARGRQLVQTRYNWEIEAEKLLEFYEEIVRV